MPYSISDNSPKQHTVEVCPPGWQFLLTTSFLPKTHIYNFTYKRQRANSTTRSTSCVCDRTRFCFAMLRQHCTHHSWLVSQSSNNNSKSRVLAKEPRAVARGTQQTDATAAWGSPHPTLWGRETYCSPNLLVAAFRCRITKQD
ncbi:unnamed protein product [Ectocarpus sp. 12 AP-2014]